MIGIWLNLLQIQNPFFHIDFDVNRLDEYFPRASYYYFFSSESRLNPVYKVNYSRRNFFFPEEKFLLEDNLTDSIKSSMEFINGDTKGVSLYFQRQISVVNFNLNFMSIDEKNYSRFLIYYKNDKIFTGLKIVDRMNLALFSRYLGISLNNESRFFYVSFKNFLLSYINDTIGLYSYFYIKEPILITHFYIDTKKDFFISPLLLLDIDKAIYLVISRGSGVGFKSDFLSFEIGYNFEKKLPFFASKIKWENFSFKIVSNSDKEWILQTEISKKLWREIEPEIVIKRTKEKESIGLFTSIYGLMLYYSFERDTLSNFYNYWGLRIKFFD